MPEPPLDLAGLGMTEIIRLQNLLSQELQRRFEKPLALAFSDIVGSTPYFARFGDEAGRRLQQVHADLLGEAAAPHGGRIVDTAGDGAFLAFPTVDSALDAVVGFQKASSRANATCAREHQLQVRIGVHWGPTLTDGAAVTGESVNLCARVAASSASGEIRLTRAVFQEAAPRHRLGFRRLGPAVLKGVPGAVELLALEWRDREQFPTLVRIEETREEVRLPAQDVISFGRLREHAETLANDVVLDLPDATLARQISRWHFEVRRLPDGCRLRSLSDNGTEVDGQQVARGQEAPVRSGTRVRVANALTLTFLSAESPEVEGAEVTTRSSD